MLSQETRSGQRQVSDGLLGSQGSALTEICKMPSGARPKFLYSEVERVQDSSADPSATLVQSLAGPLVIHITRQTTSYRLSCFYLPTFPPVYTFIHVSTHPSTYLSCRTSSHHPFMCYPPTHPSIHSFIHPLTYPSISASMCPITHIPTRNYPPTDPPNLCPSDHSLSHLPIHPSIHSCAYLPAHLSTHTSIRHITICTSSLANQSSVTLHHKCV